jgi:hypothetical protein
MSLEQAANFLSSGILFILGVMAIVAGAIVINNLIHKFWKPVTIFTRDSFSIFGGHHMNNDPMQSLTQEEYDKLLANLEKIRAEKSQVDKKPV